MAGTGSLQVILKHRHVESDAQNQEEYNASVVNGQGERRREGSSEYGSISNVDGEGERDEYDDGVAPGLQPGSER